MAQRKKPAQSGTQDVTHADTPDCTGEQSNIRLGASRPQNQKRGSNKCHWPNQGLQPCTDHGRGLDASPVTVSVNTHLCLQKWVPLGPSLERYPHPGPQIVVMTPDPSHAVGVYTQTPLQCKVLPEYLYQSVQCANRDASICLQRPGNWYGSPCKWRKTNMIAERNSHVQLCTLLLMDPWIFTPWTDPARLALIHATVQSVHAVTRSLRTLPLSCLPANCTWRSCPLNDSLKMVLLDLRDCVQEPCTMLFSDFSVPPCFALDTALGFESTCLHAARDMSKPNREDPPTGEHGRPNQRSRYRADGTRRRTPGKIKKRAPYVQFWKDIQARQQQQGAEQSKNCPSSSKSSGDDWHQCWMEWSAKRWTEDTWEEDQRSRSRSHTIWVSCE